MKKKLSISDQLPFSLGNNNAQKEIKILKIDCNGTNKLTNMKKKYM